MKKKVKTKGKKDKHPLMACGHVAQGKDDQGKPVCVICIGISAGATKIADKKPCLKGRMARCSSCRNRVKSALDLPFFAYRPSSKEDSYYCGCQGWS